MAGFRRAGHIYTVAIIYTVDGSLQEFTIIYKLVKKGFHDL